MTTNLRTKKVLCHHAEVPRISGVPTIDCVFCNVCDWRLESSPQKVISTNEAERHQTLSSQVESGYETTTVPQAMESWVVPRLPRSGTRLGWGLVLRLVMWVAIIASFPY